MKAALIQWRLLTIVALMLMLCRAVQAVNGTGSDESVGEPLYLTPLINSGQLNEARSRSQTGHIGGDELEYVLGYSGYLTVNSEFNSNLFFWNDRRKRPCWRGFKGGPGTSSMLGFFAEHGPYGLEDGDPPVPVRRPITWSRYFSIIYVDEPVGAGYSFTESEQGYARNMTDLARDMVEFLQQFFTLFPDFVERDFYVTGESFGGKFVPATAFALHQASDKLRVKINLKGIAFGNGITDPPSMVDYGHILYFLGLVDRKQAAYFDEQRDVALDLIKNESYVEATFVINDLIFNLPNDYYNLSSSYYTNVTGYDSYYNVLTINKPLIDTLYKEFVQTPALRRAIHVGENTFHDRTNVVTHMMGDILRSAKCFMPALMENYKVLVYSGHLDIAVPYTATAEFVERIPWSGADAFAKAQRRIWRPRTEPWSRESKPKSAIFGYTRRAKSFREVMIRNAGHLVPHDQPEAALDMIMRFIFDLPFADGEDMP
ncbi:hypothetical protein MTO96_008546 [Rhipicephalus appendiculatus]